jgi:hypothetical protein
MATPEPPLPQCTYHNKSGKEDTRCPLAATYIVLDPPMVTRRQPTPVWLEGERRTPTKARQRPGPLYCRTHAYTLCNLACPTQTTTP